MYNVPNITYIFYNYRARDSRLRKTITGRAWAGLGPFLAGPGRARASSWPFSTGPGRVRASVRGYGPGTGLKFRPVQYSGAQ